jgi:two-component system sensor histidine kinase BaeS
MAMVKRYLIVKLMAVNLIVVGFAVGVVWLAIDTLAAGYFVTLMEKYHISPEPAHAMFVDSIHRYLIWALAGAIGSGGCAQLRDESAHSGPADAHDHHHR